MKSPLSVIYYVIPLLFISACTQEGKLEFRKEDKSSVYSFHVSSFLKEKYNLLITEKNDHDFQIEVVNCLPDSSYSLVGLKANTQYRIIITSGEDKYIQTLVTDSLPSEYMYDLKLVQKDISFPGKLAFHQSDSLGRNEIILIDSDGDIVWYKSFDMETGPFNLTSDTTIIGLFGSNEIREFDFSGQIILSASIGYNDFKRGLHHDIKKQGDSIISLSSSTVYLDSDISKEFGVDTLRCDAINVFDTQMNLKWEWSMLDVETPFDENFDEKKKVDWGHANSIFIDSDQNYLVSFRNLNQIWKVNSKDGSLIYKFGQNGDIIPDDKFQFQDQHYAHINPRGELMIFDNGGSRSITRAISFIIDEKKGEAIPKINVELPEKMYSYKRGNVKLIDGDKLLFCSTITNNIVITDLAGKILWNMEIPYNAYRVEYFEDIGF